MIKSPVYIPFDRTGWWGGPDTRERCVDDDKVILTKDRAQRVANRSGMTIYIGKCGYLHVGHSKRRKF